MKLKRIAIVGPESTGKTWLSGELAKYYHTVWVEEFAREYLSQLGRPYVQDDLLMIAKGQLRLEREMEKEAKQFLFCDTDLLVVHIWSEVVFGQTDPKILSLMNLSSYDLHLLTDIDLPWEEDPLREHPYRRKELFDKYQQFLVEANVPFEPIRGKGTKRIESALAALRKHSLVSA
ncbi:MAG: ATP-binding protein [Bacteroidota bacterium]